MSRNEIAPRYGSREVRMSEPGRFSLCHGSPKAPRSSRPKVSNSVVQPTSAFSLCRQITIAHGRSGPQSEHGQQAHGLIIVGWRLLNPGAFQARLAYRPDRKTCAYVQSEFRQVRCAGKLAACRRTNDETSTGYGWNKVTLNTAPTGFLSTE